MTYDIKIKTDGTKVEIQNPFVDDYYTKVESDERFQPIGDYVTESELEEKGYITTLKTVNGESLVGEGDIVIQGGNDGYTKEEADAKFQPIGEYLTSVPDEYVTNDELNAKGYLTEHQTLKTVNGKSLVGTGNITIQTDLSGYYTKGETDTLLSNVPEGAKIVSLTQAEYEALTTKDENTFYNITDAEALCYTKAEADEKFLTEHQTLKTINGESLIGSGDITIEGGSTDLSNYYTKTEIDEKIGDISNLLSQI